MFKKGRIGRNIYDYELNFLGMHIDLHFTPNNFNTPLTLMTYLYI